MEKQRMRPCGDGWAYCNGKCEDCAKTSATTSTACKELKGEEEQL